MAEPVPSPSRSCPPNRPVRVAFLPAFYAAADAERRPIRGKGPEREIQAVRNRYWAAVNGTTEKRPSERSGEPRKAGDDLIVSSVIGVWSGAPAARYSRK